MKAVYEKRKETIERIFGTAKEFHQMRYTNMQTPRVLRRQSKLLSRAARPFIP